MVGIDEVGRGAWAGPLLVVAARVKPHLQLPEGLTDSKLLSKKQKDQFYQQLQIVCDFGEGWASVDEIDHFGLSAALKICAKRAVADLSVEESEEIIIDGTIDLLDGDYPHVQTIIKADITEPIVSAASVYAKVLRDHHMVKLHFTNPQYGFKDHVGYGTQAHLAALKVHGVSDYHRKSFKPIMGLI